MKGMTDPGDSSGSMSQTSRLLRERALQALRMETERHWDICLVQTILEIDPEEFGAAAVVAQGIGGKVMHLEGDGLSTEAARKLGLEVLDSIGDDPLLAADLVGHRLDGRHAVVCRLRAPDRGDGVDLLRRTVEAFVPSIMAIERGKQLLATTRMLENHRLLERRISETLSRVNNITDLGLAINDLAAQLFDIEFTGIYFRDPVSLHLRLVGSRGLEADEIQEAERTAWQRHPGRVIQRGERIVVEDTRADPTNQSTTSPRRRVEIRSRCYLPVNSGGEIVGTLGLASSKPGSFGEAHVEGLEFLADIAGLTWSRLLEQRRRETRDKILIAAGDAAERLLAARRWEDVLRELLDTIHRAFGAASAFFIDPQGDVVGDDHAPRFPAAFVAAVQENDHTGLTGNGVVLPPPLKVTDSRLAEPWAAVAVMVGEDLVGILLVIDGTEGRVHDANSIAALRAFAEPLAAKIARDRLEQRLTQSQRMDALGQLAGGVAHDINNLLMPVLGLASNLARDESDPDRRKSLLDIQLAAERGRDFVEQVLLLTRRRVATDELTNLSEVVEEAVTLLNSAIPPGVRLETEIRDRRAGVLGDRTAILRLIQNLLTNALHAVGERDGEVVIGLHHTPADETVTIEVRDNGIGMPEEIRSRLFDPFFTTRRSGSERGLGLTIVHRVTTELGGDIEVWSELEKGSAFHIRLPRVEIEAGRSDDRPDLQADPEAGTGCVLVVDDDAMVRSTTEALVGSLGYEVLSAPDGPSSLEIAAGCHPDLVLSDLSMPGMDGLELARRLRADGFDGAIALITGYGEDAIDSAAESGIDEILRKPISRNDLGHAILRLLTGSKSA